MNFNIDFPYHFDGRGRTARCDRDDHVRDMIEQLIFTSPGERVNRPDFGTGVRQLIFAPNSPELAATVQFTLQAALQHWLGDVIEVRDLRVSTDASALTIAIRYLIRELGEEREASFVRSL